MDLSQLNFDGANKVEVALARLRQFEPQEGYYLAFSGGKDSTVIYDLAVKSGVKFDAHYNQTGIDPPELVKHIREHYPTVEWVKPAKPPLLPPQTYDYLRGWYDCHVYMMEHPTQLFVEDVTGKVTPKVIKV